MSAPTLDDDFRTADGPSVAAIHRQWLDRGLPAHTWPAYLARMQQVRHAHNLDEAEMSDCEFGCKVYRCSCGEARVEHMASYGCPVGRGDVAA